MTNDKTMPDEWFRTLDSTEQVDFKTYAHDKWEYSKEPNLMWHPIVRQEWTNMQTVATAIDTIYQGIAPDLHDDPMDPKALGSTLTILHSVLKPNMDTYIYKLWAEMPTAVQDNILTQTVKRYV